MQIPWKEEYSVKVEEIDNQHKKLFEVLNKLYGSITKGESSEILDEVIEDLLNYSKTHFETEEKYFKKFNFEGTEEHIKEHERFKEELSKMIDQLKSGEKGIQEKILDFLEDWLIVHVTGMDQEYINCFQENGLK